MITEIGFEAKVDIVWTSDIRVLLIISYWFDHTVWFHDMVRSHNFVHMVWFRSPGLIIWYGSITWFCSWQQTVPPHCPPEESPKKISISYTFFLLLTLNFRQKSRSFGMLKLALRAFSQNVTFLTTMSLSSMQVQQKNVHFLADQEKSLP